MADIPLLVEETNALFAAVYDRDMAILRKQNAELRASLASALALINAPPPARPKGVDKKQQP